MTAQKRETGRNYIGLLHEETEEQRVADILAATKHRIIRPDAGDVQSPRRSEIVTSEVVTSEVVTPTPPRR
jgi:hypothetical protein